MPVFGGSPGWRRPGRGFAAPPTRSIVAELSPAGPVRKEAGDPIRSTIHGPHLGQGEAGAKLRGSRTAMGVRTGSGPTGWGRPDSEPGSILRGPCLVVTAGNRNHGGYPEGATAGSSEARFIPGLDLMKALASPRPTPAGLPLRQRGRFFSAEPRSTGGWPSKNRLPAPRKPGR